MAGYSHRVVAFRLVESGSAERRRGAVLDLLAGLPAAEPALIVAASLLAARTAVFDAVRGRGAAFGWQATTLDRLARLLAAPRLAAAARTPVGGASLPAAAARALVALDAAGELGRYQRIASAPGLPPALARTLAELRMLEVSPALVAATDPELGRLHAAFSAELGRLGLADRAEIYRAAIEAAADPGRPPVPIALLDVPLATSLERDLVAALARAAPIGLATVVRGDARSRALYQGALACTAEIDEPAPATNLDRARASLFDPAGERHAADASIQVFSAPNEARECVEIARRVLELAGAGTRFDRVAVLLRAPALHRAHLVEAFARAGVPAHFALGTSRPHPAGRALLTLLDCADEALSARAFAEYLSLSVLPAAPAAAAVAIPEDYASAETETASDVSGEPPIRAPRRWERFIVDTAVIGGIDRWRRRLRGRAEELRLAAAASEPDEPRRDRLAADLAALEALEAYALPLLERLEALPRAASWSLWLEHLRPLAREAIRDPEPVLAVLDELEPLGPVGPISLAEVRQVLAARLSTIARPAGASAGRVFVAALEAARGLAFDIVFLPGLAETVFPTKILEDPILLDDARRAIAGDLATRVDRVATERTLLQVAVGAARRQLFLSHARLDGERARPRVPSFYALEVLRAGEGSLPSLDAHARRAREGGRARVSWPAPADAATAIDETEYDLAVLESLLRGRAGISRGAARYLLETNPHLARALRFRGRRWGVERWTSADGLVDAPAAVAAHLEGHGLGARAFSATSLQHFAACPYRFHLRSIVGLAPRQVPAPVEDLGPMERGSLIHEIQLRALRALEGGALLPLRPADLAAARSIVDALTSEVAERYREQLAPAIDRVWNDSIARARRDLAGWVDRLAQSEWQPVYFELGFGLPPSERRDRRSLLEPVEIDAGIKLRGAIDVVERAGSRLRATDNKTGRGPVRSRYLVIGGGQILQPALYAMVLAKLFPEDEVAGGRLYYCTERGAYEDEEVALDETARAAVDDLVAAVAAAIGGGFLPAYPAEGACGRCDYLAVCGPYEEIRTQRKDRGAVARLVELRSKP